MCTGAGKLALLGGTSVVSKAQAAEFKNLFAWPIVNDAMRRANDRVLCEGRMSGTDIADEFEAKFAAWNGTKYASSAPNGTASLIAAFYAVGLGPGDELICPSITYWASCLGAIHLGATVVFADVDPVTLTLDPKSFQEHITPRTKAVVPVHVYGQPCDMDPIMEIARKHGIKVVEDVSHAQGGLYKGRKLGTIGDCGAMSLMSVKSFSIGEANEKRYYLECRVIK
jgi:dTDP-4-amino-4,6-dideoxygalactose transaminase